MQLKEEIVRSLNLEFQNERVPCLEPKVPKTHFVRSITLFGSCEVDS